MPDPASDRTAPRIFITGRAVVIAMLAAGVLAAVAAWAFYRQLQQPAIELWGQHTAQRFLNAPRVELLKLAPVMSGEYEASHVIEVDGADCLMTARHDVTHARGIDHVRNALVHRQSFAWDEPRGDCQPQWDYALRFEDASGHTTLAFAPGCARLHLVENGQEISVRPLLAGAEKRGALRLDGIFAEWLAE